MKVRLAELGGMILTGSPTDFGTLIADETERLGKVIGCGQRVADTL